MSTGVNIFESNNGISGGTRFLHKIETGPVHRSAPFHFRLPQLPSNLYHVGGAIAIFLDFRIRKKL